MWKMLVYLFIQYYYVSFKADFTFHGLIVFPGIQ